MKAIISFSGTVDVFTEIYTEEILLNSTLIFFA